MTSAKQFCLKWNNFPCNILSAFESLQNTEDLCDVTLTCEGINVKAHRFILSACSPYFRTVFKENPCSHPIIILKDVFYTDLVAIINFMYHGEVLVSEDQLPTFLQTAKLLQVSGLNAAGGGEPKRLPAVPSKKPKKPQADFAELPYKKARISNKPKLIPKVITNNEDGLRDDGVKVAVEDGSEEEEYCQDVNENVEVIVNEKCEQQSSILEAALEVKEPKTGSILERSLMSQPIAGKSPSSVPYSSSVSSDQHSGTSSLPEVPKSLFIPRKPPESLAAESAEKQLQQRPIKSSSSGSSSPSAFDRPSEFLQQTIKIEEDPYDSPEPEDVAGYVQQMSSPRNPQDVQPHHSSQCGNCPHCGKVYSNQSALKYHVRLVHSDLLNMYCCHLCPEIFDYREGYKKHMVEVHCVRN